MAWNLGQNAVPLKALSDFSNCQYRIVELATTEINACTDVAAGGGYGILQNNPKSGEYATVVVEGQFQCTAGAAVSIGDWIMSAASGYATTITSGATLPLNIMGRALSSAASGHLFTLDLDVVRTYANSGGKLNT